MKSTATTPAASTPPTAWAIAALMSYIVYHYISSRISRRQYRIQLPPGPKPLPLLGNILDLPPSGVPEYRHWLKHKDLYGPVSSVSVMGKTLILVNDRRAAHGILAGAHASKTAGRPHMVFANDMCDFGKFFISRAYDNAFRRIGKLIHREVGSVAGIASFQPTQIAETRRLLVRALDEPEAWLQHCKTAVVGIILKTAYGYAVEPSGRDALVDANERLALDITAAAAPMSWLPDIFPVLRHLPKDLPGIPFLKTAAQFKHNFYTTAFTPYRFVRSQMTNGTERTSFVSKAVRKSSRDPEGSATLGQQDEEDIVWAAASLYAAAGDTAHITLMAFSMAMASNPDIQQKAQAEIDSVVGVERFPDFSDRARLPYVNALIKETMRWWPVTPLGFPHTADEDFEYAGLRIPRGAFIMPNVWWFLHDPAIYADPDTFEPARFLAPRNEPDPEADAFGYGRRACPGRLFADASLFIIIVHTLATYNISTAVDKEGKELGIKANIKPGILSYTDPFQVQLTPRGEKHVELVRRFEAENPPGPGDSVHLKMVSS